MTVVIGLGIAGGAEAAPAPPAAVAPGTAIAPAGVPAWHAVTASGQQCFYEVPDCVSSDPTAAFDIVSTGDTTSCTFTADVGWGDGKSSSKSYSGGPDGSVLAKFRHTYDKTDVYAISWSSVADSGSCFSTSGTLQFTLFPCPAGRTNVALPPVDAPVAIAGKPFSFSYGRLPLTFTTVSGGPDPVCAARSDAGALPVILNLRHLRSIVLGYSVTSANLEFLPADDPRTDVPACNFSRLNSLNSTSPPTTADFSRTSNCLLTGSSHSMGTVVARWSIPGFTEYSLALAGIPLYTTPPLTYYADLTQLSGLSPTSSFQDIVQRTEAFVHTTLIANLPMVDKVGIIQDPPASLLVSDPLGRTVGLDGHRVRTFPGAGYARIGNRTIAWIIEPVPGTYHVTAHGQPGARFHADFTVLEFLGHGKDPLRNNTPWQGTLSRRGTATRKFTARGPSLRPLIKVHESRTRVRRHQVVRFSLAGSVIPFGKAKRVVWTFGDGKHATGTTVSHRYARAGRFTATVTVTDALGTTVKVRLKPIVVRR